MQQIEMVTFKEELRQVSALSAMHFDKPESSRTFSLLHCVYALQTIKFDKGRTA